MPASPLADRVAALRLWATSRIEHCKLIEQKTGWPTIPCACERRTLEAVLAMLDDDVQASVVEGGG